MALYLKLFHGARSQEERRELGEAGVWGIEGPRIGPLTHVQVTYSYHIKFGFVNDADRVAFLENTGESHPELWWGSQDEILFDGVYYADMEVVYE